MICNEPIAEVTDEEWKYQLNEMRYRWENAVILYRNVKHIVHVFGQIGGDDKETPIVSSLEET